MILIIFYLIFIHEKEKFFLTFTIGFFLIVLVPDSGYSGEGKRFCEVVCVRRLAAERLDGFHFVGRAQRAMRAERWEGFAIHLLS